VQSRERRIEHGRMALFALGRLFNRMLQIQKSFVDPHREHGLLFLVALPIDAMARGKDSIGYSDLSFLGRKGWADDLMYCSLAEDAYDVALQCADQRSEFLRQVVYPRLAAGGVPNGGKTTMDDIVKALGEDILLRASSLDQNFRDSVDSAVHSLSTAQGRLREALRASLDENDFAIFIDASIEGAASTL
jgi:hypothetical protein